MIETNTPQPQEKIKLSLADYVTLSGLLSSVIATLCIFQQNFFIGYFFILGQIVADFFDGKIARRMRQETKLGMFLDSFSDFYTIGVTALMGLTMGITNDFLFLVFPLFLGSAALRLAFFMQRGGALHGYFQGIPTTAVSFIIPTLLILNFYFFKIDINYALILYALFAITMVSKIKIQKL